MVHTDRPEERQTRSERIDTHTGIHTRTQILQTVGQCVGQLDIGCCTGFLHVVTRNRDRVELRHVFRRIFKNIGDDSHRKLGRIDIGIPHHELFQDIVLDRSAELIERTALLESGHNIEGHDRQHRTVHRHRHRHLVQRNAIEQHLHVLDRADRNAGLSDITHDPRMIGIVSPVRRQVERYGKSLLSGGQITTVKGVGLLGRRESGILTDRPRTHHVHRTVRSAKIGCDTGCIIQVLHVLEVRSRVDTLYMNMFGSLPLFYRSIPLSPATLCCSTRIF